jgi:TANFOR domain-containing protein
MKLMMREFIYRSTLSLLVGGAIAQNVHATPTTARVLFMKYALRMLVSFCVLILTISTGFSQTAPVNATLQLAPPYSVYLSDYAVAGNEQMKLNLLLRDLTEPSYEVKLHLTVEGAGIRIETNPSFVPPPIILEGGVPTILGAEDLAPYLDSRNLLFSGISRQQYDQRAALPEGFYRYCFRVIDYRRRDVELSRETCANAWFVLNDPPRINTPLCASILPLRDPQNIYFQWLAMNSVSPNAALTTEYEFTLSEIRPAGRNPNDIINTSVPIY